MMKAIPQYTLLTFKQFSIIRIVVLEFDPVVNLDNVFRITFQEHKQGSVYGCICLIV